jgi:hypothetical protein
MAGGGEVEPGALTVTTRETSYEKRLRGRLLNIARQLGMPAVDCWIFEQRFDDDGEFDGPSSMMIAAVFPEKDRTLEGYGCTRIAAIADALRRLAEYHHPGGDRFERIFSTGEAVSPEVAALMSLFRNNASVDLVALCTSPVPYLRELGIRLSAIASTVVPPHRSSPPLPCRVGDSSRQRTTGAVRAQGGGGPPR